MNKGKVKVEIAKMPNSRRDVNSSKGYTYKLLPGASRGFTPVLDKRMGTIKTGTTRDDFKEMFPGTDYDEFFKKLRFRINIDGRTLDLNEPKHQVYYNLLKIQPEVCIDEKKYNPLIHTVIVTDEEAKAVAKARIAEKKVKAYAYLHEMSILDCSKMLYLYGVDTRGGSDALIKSKMIDKAEADLDKFIKFTEDENKHDRMLLKQLTVMGILRKNGSSFYYGDEGSAIMIGANEELAISFFDSPKNQELKMALVNELEEMK